MVALSVTSQQGQKIWQDWKPGTCMNEGIRNIRNMDDPLSVNSQKIYMPWETNLD